MLYTKSCINTIRNNPAESQSEAYGLMTRASLMRPMGSTYYSLLPLGTLVEKKLEAQLFKELETLGCLDVFHGYQNDSHVSTMIPKENRKNTPILLSTTKEKYRSETKNGYGLFFNGITKIKHVEAICKDLLEAKTVFNDLIFLLKGWLEKLNIPYAGAQMHENGASLLYQHANGELEIARCDACHYSASSQFMLPFFKKRGEKKLSLEKVHTPNIKTIDDLSAFFKQPKENFIKSLFFDVDGQKVLTLVRGDRQVSEEKLKALFDAKKVKPEDTRYVERVLGLPVGFIGPLQLEQIYVLADCSIRDMENAITGANLKDYHYKNVNVGRDFQVDRIADISFTMDGDLCPICQTGQLNLFKGMALAKFDLYSDSKKEDVCIQGEIDLNRVLGCVVDSNRDEKGLIWPKAIAPYDVHVLLIKPNEYYLEKAFDFEKALKGKRVLIDDRKKSMGIKFHDAELLGAPYRLVLSKKAIDENSYELTSRKDMKTQKLTYEEVLNYIKEGDYEKSSHNN